MQMRTQHCLQKAYQVFSSVILWEKIEVISKDTVKK